MYLHFWIDQLNQIFKTPTHHLVFPQVLLKQTPNRKNYVKMEFLRLATLQNVNGAFDIHLAYYLHRVRNGILGSC